MPDLERLHQRIQRRAQRIKQGLDTAGGQGSMAAQPIFQAPGSILQGDGTHSASQAAQGVGVARRLLLVALCQGLRNAICSAALAV